MSDQINYSPTTWRCGRFSFEWQVQADTFLEDRLETSIIPVIPIVPIVMGILNVTPDSFSDGGKFFDTSKAIEHAYQMIDDGAKIIDIGGESTRPGAQFVNASEEQDRVLPIIEAIKNSGVAISIDTYKSSTMALAIEAGVDIVNDITGFASEDNQSIAVKYSNVGLCLMHMQNTPTTMQINPSYQNVLMEINDFFDQRIDQLIRMGVQSERLCIDPGIGFGKTVEHNLRTLNQLAYFKKHQRPILVGISRKASLGKIIGSQTDDRTVASVAAMLWSIVRGANIVRVHDVKQSVQAIKVWLSIQQESVLENKL